MKAKYLYIIIGIVVVILIIVGIILLVVPKLKKEKKEIGSIQTFRYFYTNGYMVDSDVFYDLDCSDKCTISIKENGKPKEEAHIMEVSEEFVLSLEKILQDNKVGNWDGFHEIEKNVMDGDSFSINIQFKDGSSLSASGYMRYPDNYRVVRPQIETLFMKTWQEYSNSKEENFENK